MDICAAIINFMMVGLYVVYANPILDGGLFVFTHFFLFGFLAFLLFSILDLWGVGGGIMGRSMPALFLLRLRSDKLKILRAIY